MTTGPRAGKSVSETDLASLFIPEMALCVATPAMFTEPLAVAEAAAVADSVESRRRHFTAGRACARRALSALGHPGHVLIKGAGGAPFWPTGIVGSLSHTHDCCLAVAASTDHVTAIGIDVEGAEPLPREVIAMICSNAELESMRQWQRPDISLGPKLMFSAKEAIYKAYFPRYQRFLDFSDVELTGSAVGPDRGVLYAKLASRSPGEQDFIARLRIRWLVLGKLVFTSALSLDDVPVHPRHA